MLYLIHKRHTTNSNGDDKMNEKQIYTAYKAGRLITGLNSFVCATGKIIAIFEGLDVIIRDNQGNDYHFLPEDIRLTNDSKKLVNWNMYI
jgi:hypothetical protein